MYYPIISGHKSQRVVTDTFGGYNHIQRPQDGEWYDTKNLTTLRFPHFSTRPRRGTLDMEFTGLQAITAKDALYWVDNGTLYANGYATELTGLQTEQETQLVSMGAYICVFPDKKYINTMLLSDFGDMGASWNYEGNVSYFMCHQDGTICMNVSNTSTEPSNPVNGQVWVDTATGDIKEYSSYLRTWTVVETVYTRVMFASNGQIPSLFKEYDGVNISGLLQGGEVELNGSKILYSVGTQNNHDYIVIVGFPGTTGTSPATVTISRKIPDMDFVCEAQNRLWGCRYGNDGTQNINEIYCCALGDFRNWEQYLGVATDSWRASIGSDGPWSGCINYLGSPTFFKENMIHPVSISPVGAHQVGDLPARGVQMGSHRSLAVVNETLFYKSRAGVMAYQGGMPADVSQALGEEKYYNAVAGAFGQRYHISMQDSSDNWHFFVYDVPKGMWMREDNLHVECFTRWGDELYAQSNNQIIALNGTVGTPEEELDWYAETGLIYYEQSVNGAGRRPVRYISRFNVKLNMARDAKMKIFIEYDSSGIWEFQQEVRLPNTGTCTIPVRPHRCDHMRIRLEGNGDTRIFQIARILEQGSDV